MGYTHHWKYDDGFNRGAWTALCEDAITLIQHFPHQLQGIDSRRPTIDQHEIYLVPGRYGVEHFQLTIDATPRSAYCKTEHTPFDRIVCALLAIAAERNPTMHIASNGTLDDWQPHLAWAAIWLRRAIKYPPLLHDL